ncbi:tetratricopeptide repeat protein [Alloacidobacterium sp.]|uniref:tetratricopeptide repeat protein n=1 Tax=Alloacidobacterium sp. TaxID=2951999 RepID=UPI002D471BBA|nr:tetratricopeptide repeat protein [Alloacidobacterium sp.]HYK37763.1 tetratricopeptide repeat protein [Alloacidobacterium sp.]
MLWLPVVLILLFVTMPVAFAQSAEDEVTPQVQELYAQAKAAQDRGDNATAIQKYRAMLKLAPHLAPAYNNLGMLYFNQRDYPHAAQVLEQGLKLNPDMPTASAMLGFSYAEMGENEKAEPLLEAAVRANPNDDNAQMALARTLIHLKRYDEATPYLKSHLDKDPKDTQAWYLLGKTYLQLSEDALGRINEIDPNSVTAHIVAGEIDESMKNYDGALVEYKKAIDMAPKQPGGHDHMGNVFWETGKWESAQTEFKAELANDPNNCTARWKLANAMLEANALAQDALTELNRAVEQCPTLMQARVDRARALVKLNKQDEALPDLLLAEKDSPNEPSIHFLLANVYRAQGKAADAQRELRTYGRLQREASESVAAQASDAISIKSNAH